MLNAEQISARKGKLTASRIACLMTGDIQAIMRLYREMVGGEPPEDLSHVWPVRLGEATEGLNLDWYEETSRRLVIRRGEVVVHAKHQWAACTLDGWDAELRCPIECKHVGGREPLEILFERYAPQTQWLMEVTGSNQCALSIIVGASAPVIEYLERDAGYADEMITRGRQFMACVRDRRPPVALDPVPPPADASKVYDMDGNNAWAAGADDWLTTKDAAAKCKDAEKILKALVPDDAKKCHGHAIQITRDRAGRLSLREAAT